LLGKREPRRDCGGRAPAKDANGAFAPPLAYGLV
jgi:hypothetical protein